MAASAISALFSSSARFRSAARTLPKENCSRDDLADISVQARHREGHREARRAASLVHDIVNEFARPQHADAANDFDQFVELQSVQPDSLVWADTQEFDDSVVLVPPGHDYVEVGCLTPRAGRRVPGRRQTDHRDRRRTPSRAVFAKIRGQTVAVGGAGEQS